MQEVLCTVAYLLGSIRPASLTAQDAALSAGTSSTGRDWFWTILPGFAASQEDIKDEKRTCLTAVDR